MPKMQQKVKIIKAGDVKNLRYPLPESWKRVAGILKGKKINALKYQRQVRAGWEKRLKKLERQFRSG